MRFDKLTTKFQQAFADAQSIAVGLDNPTIEPQHLLLALLQQEDGSTLSLLQRSGVNTAPLLESIKQNVQRLPKIDHSGGEITISRNLNNLLNLADKEAQKRGEKLNLTDDEIAFYDALEVNDSAVQVLGDDTLKSIARELVQTVRTNTTIDWTVRETVRAKLRVMVKRILRKYGYPPDKQERATTTVLLQAELIAKDWAG